MIYLLICIPIKLYPGYQILFYSKISPLFHWHTLIRLVIVEGLHLIVVNMIRRIMVKLREMQQE